MTAIVTRTRPNAHALVAELRTTVGRPGVMLRFVTGPSYPTQHAMNRPTDTSTR